MLDISANAIKTMILQSSYTKSQIVRRLRMVKVFLQYKLFTSLEVTDESKLIEGFLAKSSHNKVDADWFAQAEKKSLMAVSVTNIESVLKTVEDELQGLPVVMLYVPFQVANEVYFAQSLERIGGWFKQNLGDYALFELVYRPDLIGGAAISRNGIYKDFSIHQKLESKKNELINALARLKSHEH